MAKKVTPARDDDSRIDDRRIHSLAALMEKHGLTEIWYREGTSSIKLIRGGSQVPAVMQMPAAVPAIPVATPVSASSISAAPAEESLPENWKAVNSPIVGTFYRAPSPGAPAYVEVGAMVTKGQVICIVEAMKLMNEIQSEYSGKIARVVVENETPVEYGAVLFYIETN